MGKPERAMVSMDLGALKPLVAAEAERCGKSLSAWIREQVALALQEARGELVDVRPSTAPAHNRRLSGDYVKFGCLLSLEASEALELGARAAQLSQAEFVERMVLDPGGVVARPRLLQQLAELNRQLTEAGVNLSMTARKAQGEHGAAVVQAVREMRQQARVAGELMNEIAATRRKLARSRRT